MENIKMSNFFEFNTNEFDDTNSKLLEELKKLKAMKYILYSEPLDLISYKEYMNEQLWFVIAYYNDIIDPFTFEPTKSIGIPDLFQVKAILDEFGVKK